jgi:hypothetical protein
MRKDMKKKTRKVKSLRYGRQEGNKEINDSNKERE